MKVQVIISLFLVISTTLFSQEVITITDQINASGGVSVDSSGNIYVANFGNTLSGNGREVYKISPAGDVELFATGLNGASGNFFFDGFLYQSNINTGVISRIDSEGTVETFSTGHAGPVGIAVDKDGIAYVANCGNSTIRKVLPDGSSTLFASSSLLSCPNGLTLDENGNLYTCNFGDGRVLKISPEGNVTSITALSGNNNGHLTYRNGRLYVVSRGGNRIYEVNLDGTSQVLAGTGERGNQDAEAIFATFSRPNGIGLSPDGNIIYLNDEVSTNSAQSINPMLVRKIDNILDNVTDIETDNNSLITEYRLSQNYPNPFNPSTIIKFQIPNAVDAIRRGGASTTNVSLNIYDILGNKIATLVNEQKSSGVYEVEFNADNLSSGIYFYKLHAGSFVESKKMILLR